MKLPAEPSAPYRYTHITLFQRSNLSVSVSALSVPGAFTGRVSNSANIGMSTQEMVQLWNEEHPADPIVLETAPERQP